MKEPLSSNPQFDLMEWNGMSDAERMTRNIELCREIERLTSALHEATRREATLTAELAAEKDLRETLSKGHGIQMRALGAERDRLASENSELRQNDGAMQRRLTEVLGYNDRLRALLREADEVIIDGGRHGRRVMHLRIEEALAGAAEETDARRAARALTEDREDLE